MALNVQTLRRIRTIRRDRVMRKISIWRSVFLAVLLAVSFSYAHGADVTGRIKGTVTDPTGAVVPNATVTATNTRTGVTTTTISSASGDYLFQALPIGTYSVSVTAPAFRAFTATGIVLNIDQEFVEPVKLSLGSSADTISVEADAVQVNTTDSQLNNIVDADQIVAYPLIGRAFTQLELILPGVQAPSDRFNNNYSVSPSPLPGLVTQAVVLFIFYGFIAANVDIKLWGTTLMVPM